MTQSVKKSRSQFALFFHLWLIWVQHIFSLRAGRPVFCMGQNWIHQKERLRRIVRGTSGGSGSGGWVSTQFFFLLTTRDNLHKTKDNGYGVGGMGVLPPAICRQYFAFLHDREFVY